MATGVVSIPPNSVLGTEPQEILCPSCFKNGLSITRVEASTFTQRMISYFEKCCCFKCTWRCSKDLNHYCCHCGCFIGRHIEVGYFQEKTLKKHKSNSKIGRFNKMIEIPSKKSKPSKTNAILVL
ncbi:uncharacterized protein LOC129610078 [Condylostylus longicornis]|uniref:uncharacterized protein LOC129610078 n=1 Tax=Condylostylus longicornis TaxID=2530218 RepID=UPI00244DB497|nr:uncharacterized protein LOC129610078 [Condylostylus longicornis]